MAKTGNALSLYQHWENNNAFNSAIEADPPAPVTLYFEDIAQGYRIDVWSKTKGRWFQLCARTGAKHPGLGRLRHRIAAHGRARARRRRGLGRARHDPERHLGGSPEPARVRPRVPDALGGLEPGRGATGQAPVRRARATAWSPTTGTRPTATSPSEIDYAATPGTLPTLRFGGTYRFRARAVDIAGNSVPFTKSGGFTWASKAVTYRRFEPVPSPVLVPTAPRTPGEHLENLVIRSNYDIPDSDPSIVPCERHIAPASTGEDMAELHGVLDGPDGHPDPSSYSLIADRDGLTYKSSSVRKLYGGKIDTQPLNGKNEWVYYPPVPSPSASKPAFGVPYLPDVFSRGVSLLNLPGKKGGVVRAPFDSVGKWPERRAVRLVVKPGSGAPLLPAVQDLDGEIVVKAPKASITPVLISSYIEPADLEVMALWEWLLEAGKATPALKALILDRVHYMFTPFREFVIVHAVRQPLTPPVIGKLERRSGPTGAPTPF